MDEAIKKLLTRGGAKLGLALTEAQIEHFITYLTELKRWNRKANLGGFRTDEAGPRQGFVEHLALLKAVYPKGEPGRVSDRRGGGSAWDPGIFAPPQGV